MDNINLEKEQQLAETLSSDFTRLDARVVRNRRVEAVLKSNDIIPSVLLFAKDKLGYVHFTHMSCVDWLEEGEFEVVYILWNPEDKINLLIKVRTDRENATLPNIDYIWRQANTYERELREMFGIEFPGLVAPQEFILEDWQDMPPMRRDFKTKEYVDDHFFNRPGREDAQDVRETIANRSGEEIPEFAKKFSRK